ncbi:MAG: hypothetical protein WD042_20050 [Phycisphaeraceae bacterium]
MVQSVEGIYRNGKVELLEAAPSAGDARVIVTFLPSNGSVDLASRQISPEQAESLRARLKTIEEDWSRPEMDAYDAL